MFKKALKAAFPYTIPVMTGYIFLGMSYGILMKVNGFSVWYPFFMSIIIFGGSLEFVCVSILMSKFAPLSTLMVALMIQIRHVFYGISMLDKYKNKGWKKFLLIAGLSDETFSIVYSTPAPEGVDEGWFQLLITTLDRSYWTIGAVSGALLGNFIRFNTNGLDFVMTAMFMVILINSWTSHHRHYSELIGLISSICCLMIFGSSNFLIPTMICILVFLILFRNKVEEELQ